MSVFLIYNKSIVIIFAIEKVAEENCHLIVEKSDISANSIDNKTKKSRVK